MNSNNQQLGNLPLVSIGIPCYDDGAGLRHTLECLTSQTYNSLEIVVSDNCSTDPEVKSVAEEIASKDKRVTYHRQAKNIQVIPNYYFTFANTSGDYFMWAADDDHWEPTFVESLMSLLLEDPSAGMAFCRWVSVNKHDQIIREYPDYSVFDEWPRDAVIARYILDQDFWGKANLFYSIYRRDLVQSLVEQDFMTRSDMCLVLGGLLRARIRMSQEVLFRKGCEDKYPGRTTPIKVDYRSWGNPSERDFLVKLMDDFRAAAVDTDFEQLVNYLTDYRIMLNGALQLSASSKKSTSKSILRRLQRFFRDMGK